MGWKGISPLLFNLVVDVLARMLDRGRAAGLIKGLCPELCEGGIISLQYADDTLLFLEAEERNSINMRWILTCFEQLSGMRINYHKSELITLGLEDSEDVKFLDIFQCVQGNFPIKY